MYMATWSWGGRLQAGTASDDRHEVVPSSPAEPARATVERVAHVAARSNGAANPFIPAWSPQ